MMLSYTEKIHSIRLVNGKLEIIRKVPSNMVYACYPPKPFPDKIFKDIYSVVDGKIVLSETKEGRYVPASLTHEKLIFD